MIRCRGHMTRWGAIPLSRRGLIYVRLWGFFSKCSFSDLYVGWREPELTKFQQIVATLGCCTAVSFGCDY